MTVILRAVGSVLVVGVTTLVAFRVMPVNATTVGFIYLVIILLIATAWGLAEAIVASVAAVSCLNFFFLPPIGTFTIADPQNWVALFAFLVTSITASELSARARRRAVEAIDRRQEMERLYTFSRGILLTDNTQPVALRLAAQIASVFGCSAVALYDSCSDQVHYAGLEKLPNITDALRRAAATGQTRESDNHTLIAAVSLGGEPVGSLAVRGLSITKPAFQSLVNLLAIGLDRIRSQEAASRAEAARQSEELKSTLLDAIAHEFKTPLTSIKAAASGLLSNPASPPEAQRELATIVDEEADRLSSLVTEAIQMSRIEAGSIQLHRQPRRIEDLVTNVLRQLESRTADRSVGVRIDEGVAPVFVDPELMSLAIRQLLDNALKYSPPGSPVGVDIRAQDDRTVIMVKDCGPGIEERDRLRIFEKFYRCGNTRAQIPGSGMGLSIARDIVLAHAGEIWVDGSPSEGSRFCIALPALTEQENA
jgi:two-component system sensor histidine kinase KdpD